MVGALATTAFMLLWNYLITPIYMGMPRAAVADLLVPVFLPFNLSKYALNAAITMLIYKPVVTALQQGPSDRPLLQYRRRPRRQEPATSAPCWSPCSSWSPAF